MIVRRNQASYPIGERPKRNRHREVARPQGIARGGGNLALCLLLTVSLAHAQTPNAPVVPGAHRLLNAENPDNIGAGLILISELNCAACHILPNTVSDSIHWGPPATRPLADVAASIDPAHLLRFVRAPREAKPGTRMPGRKIPAEQAAGIARFIKSLSPDTQPSPTRHNDQAAIDDGEDLFHTLGCVACHAPRREPVSTSDANDPFAESINVEYPKPKVPSVSLEHVAQTFDHASLSRFLRDPISARMPDMKLSDSETASLAAYLQAATTSPEKPAQDLPTPSLDGAKHFVTLGCIQCHADVTPNILGVKNDAPDYPDLNLRFSPHNGCLSASPAARAPDYNLNDTQRDAIRAALEITAPRTSPSWKALGTIAANNCLACHERDGFGGVEPGRAPYFTTTIDADLGDEGRIPPPLTGVGAKLTNDALHAVLRGEGDARPYMATRMPHFNIDPAPLVANLVEADADPNEIPTDVSGLAHHHRNHYGRELVGVDALGCISCHDLNGHKSLGIPAIDLALSPNRLRPEWFMKYLLDPAALRPGTRMPAYFEDNKSTYPNLFAANARQQIEAIWIFLRESKHTRLPVGMEDNAQYILQPSESPIIHRTFMEDIGARAIAIGFPEGVHAAFDATRVRFVLAWRGDFLDANATWNDRFSPYVRPMSNDRWGFPPLMPFAPGDDPKAKWPETQGAEAGYTFKGFRLDDAKVPTLLYTMGAAQVEETFTALEDGYGFRREFTITGANAPIRFLAAIGAHVDPIADGYEVNGAWETRIEASNATYHDVLGPGGWAALVVILTPIDGHIKFAQEVEW